MNKKELDKIIITNNEIASDVNKRLDGAYSWKIKLLIFIYSVFLLLSQDLLFNLFTNVIIIFSIYFVRDLGYLCGMIIYKFKDPGLFMLPFFKGSVAGYRPGKDDFPKGITLILGSLPGMLIGIISFYIYSQSGIHIFMKLALFFTVINTIFLLPLYPFDGARILDIILLNRNIYLSVAVKSLAVALLMAVSISASQIVTPLIALLLIIEILNLYRYHVIAGDILKSDKSLKEEELIKTDGIINEKLIQTIKQKIYSTYRDVKSIKRISKYIVNIYNLISYKSPGAIKGLILTCLFLFSLATMSITLTEYKRTVPYSKIEIATHENKGVTKVYRVYLKDKIIRETEVSPQNLFSGYEKHFNYYNGRLTQYGHWKKGKLDGEWVNLNEQGKKVRIITFENGFFKQWKELKNGKWIEKQYHQLDTYYKNLFKFLEKMEPEGPKQVRLQGL